MKMMNHFSLPFCLVIEEGACERLNEILADCMPGIEEMKVLIATEPALVQIMQDYLEEMKRGNEMWIRGIYDSVRRKNKNENDEPF